MDNIKSVEEEDTGQLKLDKVQIWVKRIRLAGLIAGIVSAVAFFVIIAGWFIAWKGSLDTMLMFAGVPFLVIIITTVIAWNWGLIGGIVLIIEGVLLLCYFTFYWFLIYNIPLLVSGVLFILAWRMKWANYKTLDAD